MTVEFFGIGCISSVQSILERHQANRVFLVTGMESFSVSGAEEAIAPYFKDKTAFRFSDFSVNPKTGDVLTGVSRLREAECDISVAVGGGSVIDMAKLINILAANNNGVEDIVTRKKMIEVKGLPLIAVPTTSGSGSEATHFAVVYIDNIKYSLAHEFILPDYSIIDPSLTYSLPPRLTAVSGFDALSQAVESCWAVAATEESRGYASQAIKMILQSLESAVNSPSVEVRKNMALAAHLAGKAINITKTTAPHAISYALTSYFNIPHGHAVALTLGKFFIINSKLGSVEWRESKGREHMQYVMQELCSLFDCVSPQDCSKRWYQLMASVGLETSLNSLGIHHQSDIDRVIENVNAERLDNNPVIINKAILQELFR